MAMPDRGSGSTAVQRRELVEAIARYLEANMPQAASSTDQNAATAEMATEIARIAIQAHPAHRLPPEPTGSGGGSRRPVSLAALADGFREFAARQGDQVALGDLPGVIEDVLDIDDAEQAFREDEDAEDLESVLRDLGL